jgi:hypothetical protein
MRTHVVDARGGKDFTRIGDAIAAVDPGDTVIVNPGRWHGVIYEEQLVVDKSLEIIGADMVRIFVRAGGSVLTWRGGEGRIANLDIRNIRYEPEARVHGEVPVRAAGRAGQRTAWPSWAGLCESSVADSKATGEAR